MLDNHIIELDADDDSFMLYLFDSGIFGDIETDEQKTKIALRIIKNFYPSVDDNVIEMCIKYYLRIIKKDNRLYDSVILHKLIKNVNNEIQKRWL